VFFSQINLLCKKKTNGREENKRTKRTNTMAKKLVLRIINDEDKGNAIRFCGGTYHRRYGWVDSNYDPNELEVYMHVIVFIKAATSERYGGNIEKGVYVRVKRENVTLLVTPRTYDEAVLQQDKNIEKLINALAKSFARCGISSDRPQLFDYMREKIDAENRKYKGPTGWFIEYNGRDDPRNFVATTEETVGDEDFVVGS